MITKKLNNHFLIATPSLHDTIFKKWLDKYKYHDRYPENPREYYREYCSKILSGYEKKLNTTKIRLKK